MSPRRALSEAGAEHRVGRPSAPVALRRPLRVLIADGSPSERSGVRRALEDAGCAVCAEAADGPEAVAAAARERPDLCLVDTELPGGGGIPTAAAIIGSGAETDVIMFARSPSERDLFAALEVGACGYLTKSTDPERLAFALQRVSEGEAPLPRTLVARLIEEFQERHRRRRTLHNLTGREKEVLELLDEGLGTAEIAARLFVARVTVRTHVASILKKLGVPDREAAVRVVGRR